jgi:hypothetical protein
MDFASLLDGDRRGSEQTRTPAKPLNFKSFAGTRDHRRSPPHTPPFQFTRRRSQVRVLSRPPFISSTYEPGETSAECQKSGFGWVVGRATLPDHVISRLELRSPRPSISRACMHSKHNRAWAPDQVSGESGGPISNSTRRRSTLQPALICHMNGQGFIAAISMKPERQPNSITGLRHTCGTHR